MRRAKKSFKRAIWIHRHRKITRPGTIYKFDDDVRSGSLEIPVHPFFGRVRRRRVSRWMSLELVGRAERDVHVAAVRPPPRNGLRAESVVGVGDPAIMFFHVLIGRSSGRGVAAQPELLNELLAFVGGLKKLERRALFGADDVAPFLFEPALIRCESRWRRRARLPGYKGAPRDD